jgi:hypothetical protein
MPPKSFSVVFAGLNEFDSCIRPAMPTVNFRVWALPEEAAAIASSVRDMKGRMSVSPGTYMSSRLPSGPHPFVQNDEVSGV